MRWLARRRARTGGMLLCALLATAGVGAQSDWLPEDSAPAAREDIESAVERVLSEAEFRHLRTKEREEVPDPTAPQWIQDFFEWLASLFDFDASGSSGSFELGAALQMLAWGALAVLVVLILVLVLRGVADRRERAMTPGLVGSEDESEILALDGPPGEHPMSFWLAKAREAADAGAYRDAIRLLLLAGMSWTERRGWIRHRSGLTNRDYLRVLRRDPERRRAFARVALGFEEVYFGRRHATAERYLECARALDTEFDEKDAGDSLAS